MAALARKKLVFCFDGTSNTLDTSTPTNVAITASSVRNTSKSGPQIVYYDEGVGTSKSDRVRGGAFGTGLYQNVIDAYKFLVFNYEPHDEIFIFGFSRGAYTARSFAGLIHNIGVISSCFADKIAVATALYRQRTQAEPAFFDQLNDFRTTFALDCCANPEDQSWRKANLPSFDPERVPVVRIKYIGVWDTVKTLGSALLDGDSDGDGEADDEEFHDHNLHASVESARHAVAIDERRKKFNVTLWDNVDALNHARGAGLDDSNRPYQQVWFPGAHGSVGGGGDIRGLSDEALEWVLEGAKKAGLALDVTANSNIFAIQPDVLVKTENSSRVSWNPRDIFMRHLPSEDRRGPDHMREVSRAAIIRWGAPDAYTPEKGTYRPAPLRRLTKEMDRAASSLEPWMYETRGAFQTIHPHAQSVSSRGHTFKRHVIGAGQELADISNEHFGTSDRVGDILAANTTTILSPDRVYVGQIINIPS